MRNRPSSSKANVANDYVISISADYSHEWKKIQRVPSQFKNNDTYRYAYDPVIVSCGPYHHGEPQYERAQRFKTEYSLSEFLKGGKLDVTFYHVKILSCIKEIRACYDDVKYYDEELAWIILFDACFIIHYLQALTDGGQTSIDFAKNFGLGRKNSIGRDLILSENQIPFWIIKFLLCLRSNSMIGGKLEWHELLLPFLNMVIHAKYSRTNRLHWLTNIEEPYHFLDAILIYHMREMRVFDQTSVRLDFEKAFGGYEFRSITNLISKGVKLKASANMTTTFRFHRLYGELELPPIRLTNNGFVLFTNLVVYEMTSQVTDFYATSYMNFMRSLIEGPEDVKIMREAGVLVGEIGCADEVYKMFRDFQTCGVNNADLFWELKMDIEKHCCNTFKTWNAELIHTHFHSPWSIISLIAAFVLLCLTLLQTIFTIHQP